MTTHRATAPVGRDQVVLAVLEHAADLFAEKGPAATSVRDLAARSGVNQGLIFRHLGTKDAVLGAVLEHLGAQSAAAVRSGADRAAVEAVIERHWKVLARAILDGYPVGELQQRFPGADDLLDRARRTHDSERQARVAVANVIALQLGWRLFGPFLRSAAGLADVPEPDLRRSVDDAATRLGE